MPRASARSWRNPASDAALTGSEPVQRMNTGVPTCTLGYRFSTSGMRMRMQPCDAAYPMDAAFGVP